jgi:hypothetical protein
VKNVVRWLLYFIPALLVEVFCYLTNWIACIFVRREMRTDTVKRLGGEMVTMPRDYPIRFFTLWNTHDNALDTWWFDSYNEDSPFKWLREATQSDYDSSWWLRYICRVHWLYRNNGYGFLFYWFGAPLESTGINYEHGLEDSGKFWYFYQKFPNSFKFEAQFPILFTNRYISTNIGWKAHRSAPLPKKLYANRIIGFRQYK